MSNPQTQLGSLVSIIDEQWQKHKLPNEHIAVRVPDIPDNDAENGIPGSDNNTELESKWLDLDPWKFGEAQYRGVISVIYLCHMRIQWVGGSGAHRLQRLSITKFFGKWFPTVVFHSQFGFTAHIPKYICARFMASDTSVRDRLTQALHPEHLEVIDLSDGCGDKFHVVVVSKDFDGKPLLQRQRLVNSALVEEMKTIHALTMKTYTPEQWQQMQKDSK